MADSPQPSARMKPGTSGPVWHRAVAARLPGWQPQVIFDVGANIGQSAAEYASAFPKAAIHCFEPVPDSFARLSAATATLPRVTAHPVALGQHQGTVRMSCNGTSVGNRILADQTAEGPHVVEVAMRTGAAMLSELGLKRLSFLKIDTEGHDLDVLKGFGPRLKHVDFIQVEAGMNPYNETQVPYQKLSSFLFRKGFLLFHIFDQVFEFKKGGRPCLRRCNPVFIRESLTDLSGIH